MLNLNYILENDGWAIFEIDNGEESVQLNISYLHDTLQNLAESAIALKTKSEESVIFMDEPGEHWLVLRKDECNVINYELRFYQNYASWNLVNAENYTIKLQGATTLTKYINEVRKNLIQIFDEFGTKTYKEKWRKHDFPIKEYEILK